MQRIGLARGLLALLLLPGISLALGLGDVHLNSPLNAPLDAEIELVLHALRSGDSAEAFRAMQSREKPEYTGH